MKKEEKELMEKIERKFSEPSHKGSYIGRVQCVESLNYFCKSFSLWIDFNA